MSDKRDNLVILKKGIKDKIRPIQVTGITGSALAYLLSQLLTEIDHPCLMVFPNSEEAGKFYKDLQFFLPNQNNGSLPDLRRLFLFPSYDVSPLTGLSPPKELVSQRIEALYALSTVRDAVVVTSLEALMSRLLPKKIFVNSVDYIAINEEIDRDNLIKKLITFGYLRTSLVEERGDFAVRGGVIDLYPPLYDSAVRIEFWGNTVESIRLFNPVNQRSKSDLKELIILPANEIILRPSNIKRARSMGRLPSTLESGLNFSGIEAWLQHFYSSLDSIFNYLPKEGHICVTQSDTFIDRARSIAERLNKETERFKDECLKKGNPFPQTDNNFLDIQELQDTMAEYHNISFFDFTASTSFKKEGLTVDFKETLVTDMEYESRDITHPKASLAPLAFKVKTWIDEGNQIVLVCRTPQQAERLKEILLNYQISVRELFHDWSRINKKRGLYICLGYLSQGLRFTASNLIIITEGEIFGKKGGGERRKKEDRVQAIPWTEFSQLQAGDLVVHQDHGIGRYGGLVKMEINSRIRDFVIIEYAGNDRLYIPADRINIIQKYIGLDEDNPQLDRLGGRSWPLAKKKARRAIEEIAKDLVKIYAMRKFLKGFSFSKPDNYYREFEANFEYEETTDQIKVIDDVLSDMESDRPMDRLICGDVGFGKTEVAMRAAFKAVMDGKQVAVLSPTTVLAEQHYQTFSKRFNFYPVRVAALSRFISRTEQKRIIGDLSLGKIDIIIGTHRILSDDVVFKDLGLFIIDEEQRFGVKDKEKLKKYRNSVDIIAMTATPIPRTLHMSLMGVRDLSIIKTPPADRLSIQTYVSRFDEDIISHAIEKELERGGQVFFVHNRVQTIEIMADTLSRLVPNARIDIAHGQMKERDLAKAMIKFLARETDVLVCTTIIDSGLDIPSANTIIINNVDRFGLAEIYQLRGRVGRSNVKAYAYLLVSDGSHLTRDAQKRLKVLMDFSCLGSGVNIALNDLRIRGGGNILGFSQSGHIKAVGYELYLKMIEQAIAELKGEVWQEEIFPEIHTDLPVFIPHNYIEESDVRLDIYRRLSAIKGKHELKEMVREIEDRFGSLPKEVLNLISVIKIKIGLKKIGSTVLDIKNDYMIFSFSNDTHLSPPDLIDLVSSHPDSFSFLSDKKLKVVPEKKRSFSTLEEAEEIVNRFERYTVKN
ncbi:MAG: transcription-repair coupling factor [Deltaproteobacteria bacterium]|nr:transcription-repair coupling factor [Deltaproteobacteria bacterium]